MNETLRFDGRVAVVTGAGHGIGRLYALALAQRGARVVVNDIDAEAREAVVASIRGAGGIAESNGGNVAQADDVKGMIAAALDNFGRIDIVINNAGMVRDRAFHNMSMEQIDSVLDVHLHGSAYVTHAAWPHLRAQRYGRVIFTTSSAGLWGNFGQANYAAAKLGIVGLMNTLEIEGASHDIRVNTVAPFVMTRMGEGIFPEKLRPYMGGESVAALVMYLCSERCAVSGEVFEVGAGRVRRVRMQANEGVVLGNDVAPEQFHTHIQELCNQPGTQDFRTVWDAFESFMSHCPVDDSQQAGAKT